MPKYINSDDIGRLAREINIHDKCKVVHDNEFELSVVGWFLDLHNEINRKSQEISNLTKGYIMNKNNSKGKQGRCGGTPRKDGSGGGKGNRGTVRQPPKKRKTN